MNVKKLTLNFFGSVKDTLNILTHNQWSGSEYLSNNTGFRVYNTNNVRRETNNNWSMIGENSLKLTKLTESSFWVRVLSQDELLTKTITGKLTIRTTDSAAKVYLLELNGGTTVKSVGVEVSANSVVNVSLSLVTGDTNTNAGFHIQTLGDVGDICYIDDIQLFAS